MYPMGMILHVSVSEKFHPKVVIEKTPPHEPPFTLGRVQTK